MIVIMMMTMMLIVMLWHASDITIAIMGQHILRFSAPPSKRTHLPTTSSLPNATLL